MLDPITALGVAGNVIQFVDFGSKLVSNSISFYHGQDPVGHEQLRAHATQLLEFDKALSRNVTDLELERTTAEATRQREKAHLAQNAKKSKPAKSRSLKLQETMSQLDEESTLAADDGSGEIKVQPEQSVQPHESSTTKPSEPNAISSRVQEENRLLHLANLLENAAGRCRSCAEELYRAVGEVMASGTHKKWQSFRLAISSIWNEAKLDQLQETLDRARQVVHLFLVLYTR
jgi:hypothetical protein